MAIDNRRWKRNFLIWMFFLTTFFVFGQKFMPIRKLNGSKITVEDLTSSLNKIVDSARITGLSIVIINTGKEVYKKTFGFRNKETLLDTTTAMYAASFLSILLYVLINNK